MKKCLNKWRDKSCAQIEKFSILKMLILSKWIYGQHNPNQNLSQYLCRNLQTDSKTNIKSKGTKVAKTILKNNKVEKSHRLILRL